MKPPPEKRAGPEIVSLLEELLGASAKAIRLERAPAPESYDYSIRADGYHFLVEYKTLASAGLVAAAADRLTRAVRAGAKRAVPLVVVPFMGPVGRAVCDKSGLSWLDLSGNAKIVAPGLRIWIEGRPNKYVDRGRPPNVFAPKSSRVARQLLFEPRRFQTQAEIVRRTGLDDGYVSKVVRRLESELFVERDAGGAIRPRDPDVLLDAWHGVYDFSRHRITKGHVPTRSGEELLARVAGRLARERVTYAATGLAAAWLLTTFAAFRLATIYLSSVPSRSFLEALGFSDEPKGANLWLVIPDDEGVFLGSQGRGGVQCVSAVQTYLDLKSQPERAKDAAAQLRSKVLDWSRYGG